MRRLQTARLPLMSQTEKSFTVSDRRHFTPDGRPRDDAEERTEPEAPTHSAPSGASAPRSPGAPADLSQFLLTLAAQAGMLLNGEGLPEGAGPADALEGARSVISILDMLKEKTEGPADERRGDAARQAPLPAARIAYVEKTRAGERVNPYLAAGILLSPRPAAEVTPAPGRRRRSAGGSRWPPRRPPRRRSRRLWSGFVKADAAGDAPAAARARCARSGARMERNLS